jgi:hypothetical protein
MQSRCTRSVCHAQRLVGLCVMFKNPAWLYCYTIYQGVHGACTCHDGIVNAAGVFAATWQ